VVAERELGSGEYGVVELGRLDKNGQTTAVAIKRLKGEADAEQQERFLTEAWITGRPEPPKHCKGDGRLHTSQFNPEKMRL
jgi:hypothetical protein